MVLLKLILVDDETTALSQFKDILQWEDYGFELVSTFSDSADAIDYIKENEVHGVITDIKMPGMTGIEMAQYCSENYPDVKFVLISAYRDFNYATTAIKCDNVLDYLLKPLTFASIENALHTLHNKICDTPQIQFANDEKVSNIQELTSDILCGVITSKEALEVKRSALNIPCDFTDLACVMITFHIDNLDAFTENTWKHGKPRLYNAISLIVNSSSETADTYLIRYSHYNFECMIIQKTKDANINDMIDQYKAVLVENFSTLLNLDISFIQQTAYTSLATLISYDIEKTSESIFIDNDIINMAFSYIKENYKNDIGLDSIANHVALSKIYFCSYFKKHTGESFTTALNKVRVDEAKKLLLNSDVKISELHKAVGYKSLRYFYKIFKELTGLTPNAFRSDTDDAK